MLRDSFWYPTKPSHALVIGAVLLMVILRQSELVGLMDSTVLLFGWLPFQFAYDIIHNVIAVVIAYGLYRLMPDPPQQIANETEDN